MSKIILATAYAVNPYKGSEDAMGWNFVLQVARFNPVIAITRENNRYAIEEYMRLNPDTRYESITFKYFDLPYWMRFWKKGGRGAMLYYLMWQRGVVAYIKKQNIIFNIAHNLNFHNDWTPSFLWKLGKPFVWGPVGHHPLIPTQYLLPYFSSYRFKDKLTWMVKLFFWNLSPSLANCKRRADHIMCMNSGVPSRLKLKDRYSVAPSVATQDFGWSPEDVSGGMFRIISAGRLVPLKGFDLAIHSFARFYKSLPTNQQENCEFLIVGSGPAEVVLKNIVEKEGVGDVVRFISWMERADFLQLFKTSKVFLFPSHEGAGMVVAEAFSFGVPVVCLDNEGPGQYVTPDCGMAVAMNDYDATVGGLAEALHQLYGNPEQHTAMSAGARRRFEELFHWDRRGDQLMQIYNKF
jgi:glycosyltransferase involved in cell wall biosynthesis